LKVMLF